jgi:hypothetical protein
MELLIIALLVYIIVIMLAQLRLWVTEKINRNKSK